MKQIIAKKLVLLVTGMLLLILAAHFIFINIPGDPVRNFIPTPDKTQPSSSADDAYAYWHQKLGLNLPDFYFSVSSAALPSVYYKTPKPEERVNIKKIAYQYGNKEAIENFILSLKLAIKSTSGSEEKVMLNGLMIHYQEHLCRQVIESIKRNHPSPAIQKLSEDFNFLIQNSSRWKKFIPVFSFHPLNRFHLFLFGDSHSAKGLVRGDFGISWITKLPVSAVIFNSLKWTFTLSFISLLITLCLSIVIGVVAGSKKNSRFDNISSAILIALYSLPVFCSGTLMLLLLSNPNMLQWLPASGVQPAGGFSEQLSFIEKAGATLPFLVMPLVCYIYPSLAFLSRTIRGSMIETMSMDFILAGRAKGLNPGILIWKHAFRNVLLPLITLIALSLPGLFSGSVIIETIYSIPGLGLETFHAVQNKDYPVLIGIFTLTGIIAMLSFFIADMMYSIAEPKLKNP